MIYFTSDLHFGHSKIIEYSHRPYENLEQMHEALIFNWNSRVSKEDTIYVLGDLALCPYKLFIPVAQKLNGNKILIQGNHDKYSIGQYNSLGFQVFLEVKMKIAGQICRLSHYPYAVPWYKKPFVFKSELRFMDRRPPRIANEVLLHGHTHTAYKSTKDNRIHVGVDAWNYRPAALYEIESLINKKKG